MIMDKRRARIARNKGYTRHVSTDRCIRKWDTLSTAQLNLVIEGTVKATGIKRTAAQSFSQLVARADDTA